MKTIVFLLQVLAVFLAVAAAAAAAAAEPIGGAPTLVLEHQEEDTQSSSNSRWLQANSSSPEGPPAAIDTSSTCPCQSESNNSSGAEPMILQVLVYNVEGIKKMGTCIIGLVVYGGGWVGSYKSHHRLIH